MPVKPFFGLQKLLYLTFSFISSEWTPSFSSEKKYLLNFVAFYGVESLFVIGVEKKVGVDNKKALGLTNGIIS